MTDPTPTHSLSSGQPLQSRWLGAGSGTMGNQNPSSAISMLIGMGGSGKTTLNCSDPDALILNFDAHSAPVPLVRAGVWPLKSPEGVLVDGSGTPIDFTWRTVEERMLKPLVDLAAKKQPRPRRIVFDTVPLAIQLIKDHLLWQHNQKPGAYKKESWKDLHGPTAWDDLFNTLISWCLILNRSGYGVTLNVHVRDILVKTDDDKTFPSVALSITDNFFGRLHPICELIAHVYAVTEHKVVSTAIPGKSTTAPVTVSYLSTTTPGKTGEFLKSRYRLEKVKLSPDNGWADLMKAWDEASRKPLQ